MPSIPGAAARSIAFIVGAVAIAIEMSVELGGVLAAFVAAVSAVALLVGLIKQIWNADLERRADRAAKRADVAEAQLRQELAQRAHRSGHGAIGALQELKRLRDDGIISDDQFGRKRNDLLDRI